jgi:hypothetical protein
VAGPYNYYLARLPWLTTDPFLAGRYEAPAGMLGMVDLRNFTQQSTSNAADRGWAFVWGPGTVSTSGGNAISLGSGDCREITMTTARRNAFSTQLGYSPQGDNLAQGIKDFLLNGTDPAGENSAAPLRPTRSLMLEVWMHGHSCVASERLIWGRHSYTNRLRDSLHRQFRQCFELEQNTARRMLDYWCEQYGLVSEHAWKELVPRDLLPHVEGRLRHHTAYGPDTFTNSDGTNITAHTAGGITWAQGNGTWEIDTNALKFSSGGGTFCNVRAEHDHATDDHWSQCKVINSAITANLYSGSAVRMASGSTKTWYCGIADTTTSYITKHVAGVQTNIVTVATARSAADVQRTYADGSIQRSIVNGSARLACTDTAITGNLRAGLVQLTSSATVENIDDYSSSDVATNFPVVGATTQGNSGANASQHTITLPSHSTGDLLLVLFTNDGNASLTIGVGTNWQAEGGTNGTALRHTTLWKVAQSASETLRIDSSAGEGSAYVCYRINTGSFDANTDPAFGTRATGASANPNPPSITASWGAESNLVISTYGWDGNVSHTSYPQGYANSQVTDRWANSQGCGIAAACSLTPLATEDPGTATIGTEDWCAQTIAIRPALPSTTIDATGALGSATTEVTAPTQSSGTSAQVPDAVSSQSSATAPTVTPAARVIDVSGIVVTTTAAAVEPATVVTVASSEASSQSSAEAPTLTAARSQQPLDLVSQSSAETPVLAAMLSQQSVDVNSVSEIVPPDTQATSPGQTVEPDTASALTSIETPDITEGTVALVSPGSATQSSVEIPSESSGAIEMSIVQVNDSQASVIAPITTPIIVTAVSSIDTVTEAAAPSVVLAILALVPDVISAAASIVAPDVSQATFLLADAALAQTSIAMPSLSMGANLQQPTSFESISSVLQPSLVLAITLISDVASGQSSVTAPVQLSGSVMITVSEALSQSTILAPSMGGTSPLQELTPDPVASQSSVITPSTVAAGTTASVDAVIIACSIAPPSLSTGAATREVEAVSAQSSAVLPTAFGVAWSIDASVVTVTSSAIAPSSVAVFSIFPNAVLASEIAESPDIFALFSAVTVDDAALSLAEAVTVTILSTLIGVSELDGELVAIPSIRGRLHNVVIEGELLVMHDVLGSTSSSASLLGATENLYYGGEMSSEELSGDLEVTQSQGAVTS